MAEVKILALTDLGRFEDLFQDPHAAEGSWGWFQSLAETTLEPGEEAVCAVAFEGETAKAALPLARKGGLLRALTAPYTTRYMPAFADAKWASYLGARARSFVDGSLRIDALDPTDSNIAAFLEGLSSSGLFAAQYRNFANFYERIASFESYWIARPSRLKSTVRRKLAQAASEQIEFRCHRSELADAAHMYEEVYRASWKQAEPHPRFIRTMVEKVGQYGFIRIGIMRLRGAPVAVQIWLVCGRKATIFKLAHREDVKELSPGTLLTQWMAATLIRDEGLTEIDFGRGSDAYKRDWLSESRTRIGIVAGNWSTLAGLGAIATEVLPTRLSAVVRKFKP
jgi:CelD/BcsL family acetyltransferase involved in cellulose biosynthesis